MKYNTEQKAKIIEFLKKNQDEAFTAAEIYRALSSENIGKSTVFRRLAELSEEGVIRRIADASTRRVSYRYNSAEHCTGHLHLSCINCGKLIHLDEETSRGLEKRLIQNQSFHLDPSVVIPGICDGCTKNK